MTPLRTNHRPTLATRVVIAGLGASLALVSVPPAARAMDGGALFDQECSDCHSLKGKSKKGPPLSGVIGRKAGTYPDFTNYSDAMKAKGVVWSADKIDTYIKAPKVFVPGGTMKYDGLADAESRTALIAFIAKAK